MSSCQLANDVFDVIALTMSTDLQILYDLKCAATLNFFTQEPTPSLTAIDTLNKFVSISGFQLLVIVNNH